MSISSAQSIFLERTATDIETRKAGRSGTFTDNMKMPVHRWFRYSAGFSAEWVENTIQTFDGVLFDPFAGSGTSLLAAQTKQMPSIGVESHPFVSRIAQTKLNWRVDPETLRQRAADLLDRAQRIGRSDEPQAPLLGKCFTVDALDRLDRLRLAHALEPRGDRITGLLWLAITAILRECSGVGTAQWQYILPNKSKASVSEPFTAFTRKIAMFADDIAARSHLSLDSVATHLIEDDARSLDKVRDLNGKVTLVVTSPPYPNNYDYADATRLEMTFWREIDSWSDLHGVVRKNLVCSCSQHASAERLQLENLLESPVVAPIRDDLRLVCEELAVVRETRGGRKAYHTMVAAYFNDLARTWTALRSLCAEDAALCFVIGDSAPYGVYVPVDEWLARLAVAAGFREPRFDKIRDRNLKWKNRKHRVPLKEGNLWLRG